MATEESVTEMPLVVPRVFYLVILAFGIAFYLIWGAMFGAWTDIAVYTVTAVTVGFGIVGTVLYTLLQREGGASGE